MKEDLLTVLLDTGFNRRIKLEALILTRFIKTDDSDTPIWSTMGGQFTKDKNGMLL
jgi:hypothetical protein